MVHQCPIFVLSQLHLLRHVTPNAQPHQDKELVKVMENVFVGGDGLGLMHNTSYQELLKTELWYSWISNFDVILVVMICKEQSFLTFVSTHIT